MSSKTKPITDQELRELGSEYGLELSWLRAGVIGVGNRPGVTILLRHRGRRITSEQDEREFRWRLPRNLFREQQDWQPYSVPVTNALRPVLALVRDMTHVQEKLL